MDSISLYYKPIDRFFLEHDFKIFIINPLLKYALEKKNRAPSIKTVPMQKCNTLFPCIIMLPHNNDYVKLFCSIIIL